MKRWKVYLCAAVFLLLTAVKMIAPAAAADAREVLLPAINADDDYKSVFAERSAACLRPRRYRRRTNSCGSICPP